MGFLIAAVKVVGGVLVVGGGAYAGTKVVSFSVARLRKVPERNFMEGLTPIDTK